MHSHLRPPTIAVLVAAAILGGCRDEPSAERFAPRTGPDANTDAATASPARPVRIEGNGAGRRTIGLARDGPIAVTAVTVPRGRFFATIRGTRYELILFDGPTRAGSTAAVPASGRGPVEIRVEAEGRWALSVRQPMPGPRDVRLPGTLSGRGPAAIPVRVPGEPPASVVVSYGGPRRLDVWLFPYDEDAQGIALVEVAGRGSRRVSLTAPVHGSYLMGVMADGAWRLRFEAGE